MKEPYGDLYHYDEMLLEKSISAIYEVSHQAVKMLFVTHGGAIAALVVFTNPSGDADGNLKCALVMFFLGLIITIAAQIMLYVGHRGEMEAAATRLGVDVNTIFSGWVSYLQSNPYASAFRLVLTAIALLFIGGVWAAFTL